VQLSGSTKNHQAHDFTTINLFNSLLNCNGNGDPTEDPITSRPPQGVNDSELLRQETQKANADREVEDLTREHYTSLLELSKFLDQETMAFLHTSLAGQVEKINLTSHCDPSVKSCASGNKMQMDK